MAVTTSGSVHILILEQRPMTDSCSELIYEFMNRQRMKAMSEAMMMVSPTASHKQKFIRCRLIMRPSAASAKR